MSLVPFPLLVAMELVLLIILYLEHGAFAVIAVSKQQQMIQMSMMDALLNKSVQVTGEYI